MKARIHMLRETLKHIGMRSILMIIVVFLITAGIATYAGVRYYYIEKQVLLQRGELNAKESAMEYNRYLLTRVNIVTLVGCNLDDMIEAGSDYSTIEAYLVTETENIIATLDPGTTGLYGIFNGEYIDGAGWVPDDDYVPTERPWYVQTMASDDKITFVEPYLDAQTGTIMMTVSSLLSDGENIIAMDVSLAPIQEIVKQISSSTEGSQAFVLDENGTVVAHSDESNLGKNYLDAPESLGGAVAKKLLDNDQKQFDIKTAEGNFSVYVDELEGGWYSVSLINADIWYRPLTRGMISFAVILSLVILFVIVVFFHLNAKNLAMEKLNTKIDQEEKRGDKFKALSETDRMTGLRDRVSGEHSVNELLSTNVEGMFVELDIDHFKSINDTFGHQTGDLVIHAVADALRATFRTNDILMRLGGDEFGVFAVGIVDPEMGETIIGRLFNKINSVDIPELGGGGFCISVGAALCADEEAPTFEKLYARADNAMYVSKRSDGNFLTFN